MKEFLKVCVSCATAKGRKPGKQARLEIVNPKRRFAVVAIDIQTITVKPGAGKTKVIPIINVFTRFVGPVAIPDENAEKLAQGLLREWISLVGPTKKLLFARGPNILRPVVSKLAERLRRKCLVTYRRHPAANEVVKT